MIELAISRSDQVDEATIGRLYAALPELRKVRSDAYYRQIDRRTSIVSFALLQLLWSEQFAGPMPEIVVGIFGKPAFAGVGVAHFNISHDQTVCACVLAPVSVGVDLQSRVPFDEDLFDRIASQTELRLRDQLVALDDLSPLWTRKEAVVKRTGRGLTMPFQTIEALSAPGVLTMTCDEPDVRLSLSAAGRTTEDLLADVRIRFLQPHSGPDEWSSVPAGELVRPFVGFPSALAS
ncbi:MAG TPA: 4'-phosphopantetheinyl transferase superfamily protein [Microlunatus sp.]